MKLRKYRGRVGTLAAVAIFGQATVIMFVPMVEPNWEIITLEVSILAAVLGIDIAITQRLQTIHDILGVVVEEKDE